jgi:hypothetical protein
MKQMEYFKPTAYQYLDTRIYIEARGDDLWAVVESGCCLNKKGQWEYEPLPSNRTKAFLKRCRFTKEKAFELCLKK